MTKIQDEARMWCHFFGMSSTHPVRSPNFWAQIAIVFGTSLLILAWVGSKIGLTWDESTYFLYVESLRQSLEAGSILSDIHKDPFLSYWINPHPALQKWTTLLFARHLESALGCLLAWRVPSQIWVATEVALAFQLILRQFGIRPAVIFLAALVGIPRFVAYSSLGIQDGLVAMSWLNIALLARNLGSTTPSRTWALFTIVAFIAAGAKITGWLALMPVGILMLLRRDWKGAIGIISIAVASATFATAITPNFWTAEFYRAPLAYILYPVLREHVPISVFYEGKQYLPDAPWHWGPMILYATTPPLVLALGLAGTLPLGFVRRARWLLPFLFFWLLLLVTPSVPRHDDVRQFLPLIPLAILGGSLAFDEMLPPSTRGSIMAFATVFLLSAAQAWFVASSFPLSYFSPLVGNLEGAEKRGFDITLYFEALGPEMIGVINENLPRNARLAQLPQWTLPLTFLQRRGVLRADLRIMDYKSPDAHDAVLVYRRRAVISDENYFSGRSLAEIRFRGVSMMRLIPLDDQRDAHLDSIHPPRIRSDGQ